MPLLGVDLGAVAGGGEDPLAAGTAQLRVDQHRGVGPVGQHLHDRQGQLGRGPPQQRRAAIAGRQPRPRSYRNRRSIT